MRKIVIIGSILAIIYYFLNKDVYYIAKWNMYVKIENKNDTTKVLLSNSRWCFGDNYIKYCPVSAEISNLNMFPYKDTLYAQEQYIKITEIKTTDYHIKPVHKIWVDKIHSDSTDYWSDSTFLKNEIKDWISINHRHGLQTSWE